MGEPRISCIIPCFNAAPFLAEAIESAVNQTLRPEEIIVVDDGSTDDSANIAKRYSDAVRYQLQDHGGTASARNLGLQLARGDYIAYLDADDLWHPEKSERQIAHLKSEPAPDIANCWAQNFWMEDIAGEENDVGNWALAQPQRAFLIQAWMIPRFVFDRVGMFNTSFTIGSEHEWMMRSNEAGFEVTPVPDILLYRRLHRNNTTRREVDEGKDAMFRLIEGHRARLSGKRKSSPATDQS